MGFRRNPALAPTTKAQGGDDEKAARELAKRIAAALDALAASATSKTAQSAISSGSANSLLRALDWDAFSTGFTDATLVPLAGVHLAKGLHAMNDLSPATAVLDFTMLEPRAISWATQHAGSMVTAISADIRGMVNDAITAALRDRVDVYTTARLIRDRIPLHDRFQQAVERTYDRVLTQQINAGKTAAQARELAMATAERQAQRLRTVRAETIARTEIMSASNAGRFEGWATQIAQGNVSADSIKEWTVGDEACPQICDALQGERVRWDEPFSSGDMMPPAHPGCRCTGVLLPPDVEKAARSNPDRAPRRHDLTNAEGATIAADYLELRRGRRTQEQHQELVLQLTGRMAA